MTVINHRAVQLSSEAALRLLEMGAVVIMRTTNQNGAGTSSKQEPESGTGPQKVQVTPHWNAIGGLVAIGVLYALLPVRISFGPYGLLLLAIEAVFLLPFVIAVVTRRSVSPVTLRVGSMILFGIVTLPNDLKGLGLLETGLLLYGCNILMFALWYWEIDGGGPVRRQQPAHQLFYFLFRLQL